MKPMWKPAALTVVLTLAAATARAQISTTATPVYHGTLRILRPAVGTFDTATGIGTLRVRRWRLGLREDSNGIFPDQEPIVVALGEESFRLEAGSLTRSRKRQGVPLPSPARRASAPSASRSAPVTAT